MRKILISKLILVTILFISFSCAKKNDPSAIDACKVVSFTNSTLSAGTTTTSSGTVTYGSDDQVQSILYSNGSKNNYTYSGSTVTVFNVDASGKTTSRRVYTIGSNGYASKEVYTAYSNGVPSSTTSTSVYEYDGSGYLTKVNYSSSSGYTTVDTYTYSAGNLTSYKIVDDSTTDLYVYEYDTDKTDNGTQNYGVKFGKNNKNLLKKEVNTYGTTGTTLSTYYTSNYTYTLDSKNNVTQKVDNTSYSFSGGTSTYTYNYVYECKQ